MKASLTLRNNMLGATGFKSAMETTGMFMFIYSGTVPATASAAAEEDNLLVTITAASVADATLLFENAAITDGTLSKESTQTWSGVVAATGTATFFRLVGGYGDSSVAVTAMDGGTAVNCIQGTVGVSGCDLNLVSTSLVSTTTQTIEYFVVSLPTD
jgi:hypothetical protein